MQNINEIKNQICDVCHKMWQLGWEIGRASCRERVSA